MSEIAKGNEIKQLQSGDWIVAYRKGYHQITKIERRFHKGPSIVYQDVKPGEEYNALVYYKTIHPKKLRVMGPEHCCDIAYCFKAGSVIAKEIERLQKIQEMMK